MSANPVFKIADLLVSIVPAEAGVAEPAPDGYIQGTILTNEVVNWPGTDFRFCGHHGVEARSGDPALLAGVKSLLRAQIAALEAGAGGSPDLAPSTVADAAALEAKLEAALAAVRSQRAALEAGETT